MTDRPLSSHFGGTDQEDVEGLCAYSGHVWAPMGGGLYVCMQCDEEAWDIDPEELDG